MKCLTPEKDIEFVTNVKNYLTEEEENSLFIQSDRKLNLLQLSSHFLTRRVDTEFVNRRQYSFDSSRRREFVYITRKEIYVTFEPVTTFKSLKILSSLQV